MRLPRFFGLLDLAVIVFVAIVVLVLQLGRARTAVPAPDDVELRYALALAEARVDAHPADGAAVEDYAHLLVQAGLKDWAVDATLHAAQTAPDSPTKWRTLLAASDVYGIRNDAKNALDFAEQSLAACDSAGDAGCPRWERNRVKPWRDYLRCGVDSGIDPRRDVKGFKAAANSCIHLIRLKSTPSQPAPR
jgi:hypothetical protein